MTTKTLHGKDGELILIYKNTVFANAERFTAELIEQTALVNINAGTGAVSTGYKSRLHLNDVTITDESIVDSVLADLHQGENPELGFQGKFRRKDGFAERIIFRNCQLDGTLDMIGLARGFVWGLELFVNSLTDEQAASFHAHGSES
jgi:hypothetical protein